MTKRRFCFTTTCQSSFISIQTRSK